MAKSQLTPDDIIFIRNLFRQGSIKWTGRAECLRLARKKVQIGTTKDGRPKYKFHWQCAHCKQWHREEKMMEVDHIVEIGPFLGDWNEDVIRHFPRPVADHLQALCQVCHLKKTNVYNNARLKWQRKK